MDRDKEQSLNKMIDRTRKRAKKKKVNDKIIMKKRKRKDNQVWIKDVQIEEIVNECCHPVQEVKWQQLLVNYESIQKSQIVMMMMMAVIKEKWTVAEKEGKKKVMNKQLGKHLRDDFQSCKGMQTKKK